jgi:hypothetical protein
MRILPRVLAAALAGAPAVAAAQTPAPAPPPPDVASGEPGGKPWTDLFKVDALVDFYYAYQIGGGGVQRLVPAFHVFSDEGNSLTLAYAKLGVGVKAEPVGLRLDLGYGHVADVIAADKGAGPGGDANVIRFVEQAYMTFAVPVRVPLTIDVGKFVSAGAEAIEANLNWNYSHTFIFGYGTPYTLTGLRLSVSPTPRWTLQGFLVNGWDVVFDNNAAKTLGAAASYQAPTGTTLSFNGLAGVELPGAGAPWRFLADLVAAQKLGRGDVMLELSYVHEGPGHWVGAAGYVRFAPTPVVCGSLRGEVFVDDAGLLQANTHVRVEDVTLTAGFPIAGHAEVRAEGRVDFADQPFYLVDTTLEPRQLSVLAAAVAWF